MKKLIEVSLKSIIFFPFPAKLLSIRRLENSEKSYSSKHKK